MGMYLAIEKNNIKVDYIRCVKFLKKDNSSGHNKNVCHLVTVLLDKFYEHAIQLNTLSWSTSNIADTTQKKCRWNKLKPLILKT